MMSLSARELSLVKEGYSENQVRELVYYSEEELMTAAEAIYQRITRECMPVKSPVCIYLGGQPGCGKSTFSQMIKKNYKSSSVVEIGLDNYRTYHPNYLEMEKVIKEHWKDRKVTDNHSPGNDIANFTHGFAGRMTDLLIDMVSQPAEDESYHMVLEWGMRTPDEPLKMMEKLKQKGYCNVVYFIAVHQGISLEACRVRADIMNGKDHIFRRIPNDFHELAVSSLPESCNCIFENGYQKEKFIDEFFVMARDGAVLWEAESEETPGIVFQKYLEIPELSREYRNDFTFAERSYWEEAAGICLRRE